MSSFISILLFVIAVYSIFYFMGKNPSPPMPIEPPKEDKTEDVIPEEISRLAREFNHLMHSSATCANRAGRRLLIDSAREKHIEIREYAESIGFNGIEYETSINDISRLEETVTGDIYQPSTETSMLVAIIDCETTGLEVGDEPISLALVLLDVSRTTGHLIREVASYEGLREPNCPINPKAHAVHGMTAGDLKFHRWDSSRACAIIDSSEILIAHNAKFDRRMLAKVFPWVKDRAWACSMLALRDDWSALSDNGRSLDAICNALDINRPHPHNAMSDCIALQKVLFSHSGKTTRSKTYMAKLMRDPWAPPE